MSKNKLKYPLEQVLVIKKRRVDAAEKIVKEKQAILEQEEEKLKKYQDAYQEVADHHKEKLEQLRAALDAGAPSHKIEQIRTYIKEVKNKMYEEKRKVERQEKQVEKAQKAVDDAKIVLKERRVESDKIHTHKDEWSAQELKELSRQEAKQLDEVGSLVFLSNQRKENEKEEVKRKKRGR